MRAFRRFRFWRHLRRRLSIVGVLFVYLLAALEIPLPAFVHKISSQPFPCQHHACGCQTAEQCWSHCCCFTPEERWAWAKAHNIEPPVYAEKPIPSRSSPLKGEKKEGGQGWYTIKLRDRDRNTTTAKNCCCSHKKLDAPVKESSDISHRWGTMMTAWRCQGYSTLWISMGAVLPVFSLTAWSPEDVPSSRIPLLSIHADKVSLTPSDPPPRLSLV
jgi:hypothetical protein